MKTKRTIIETNDGLSYELTATHLKQRHAGQSAYSMTREQVRKAFTRMTNSRKNASYFVGRRTTESYATAWKTNDGSVGVGCTGFSGDNAKQLLTWARARSTAKTTSKKTAASRKKSLVA